MKYLAEIVRYLVAIPLIVLFAAIDIILTISLIGIVIAAEEGGFPLSYNFALKIFTERK